MCGINLILSVEVTKAFIFDVWFDGQFTSTVEIIFDVNSTFLPPVDASWKMSALCLDLIYFCLSVSGFEFVEVKHALRILIRIE